ncbi:titin homolog [Mercenaria mercenaria]|uniref:titin homolog n=1 Tax=Mercenaria mercenaria TaxID=6596 RepID=UPI00234F10CC|nr:titin homolog [Mercenaria mercenaria]
MRTIKDPKKKPELRRRTDLVEEEDDADDRSTKSTPPKKRKTAKASKDESSSLNDSGSFVDNQSDILSERSSVIGDDDASDISSLKSTPPKKRSYNRVLNKSPEVNGETVMDNEDLPEKKSKPKKKVKNSELPSTEDTETKETPEKKLPKAKKKVSKQLNKAETNDLGGDETDKKSDTKKKNQLRKNAAKPKTDTEDGTVVKKKPGRKRKLSGIQNESNNEKEGESKETVTKLKKGKKTKKQLLKEEAQSELKRQTEELRKTHAEKSNLIGKSDVAETNEAKGVKNKTKKKIPSPGKEKTAEKDEGDKVVNDLKETDDIPTNTNLVGPDHSDSEDAANDSDESSDLDTSFDSINSDRKDNISHEAENDLEKGHSEEIHAGNKSEPAIKCDECGYISRSKGGHTRHLRKCQPEKLGLEPELISKPKFHQCEECEYSAPKRVLVINHMRTHGIYQCKRCKYRADSDEILEDHCAQEHKDRSDCKFCKNCNRYVKCSEIPLEKHMEECQGRIPFKCPECSKEFQYESSLKCHVVSHYPDQPKLFSCDQCDYKSNYKANLKKHIRHIHEQRGERNVKCTECDKLFYTEDNMKRHLKLHSEERPYKCEKDDCNKAFKTPNGLKFHLISHQTDRPFPCDIEGCEKSFKSTRALALHLNETHQKAPKNFKCEEEGCEMAFYKKCHLDRHTDAHKDNRTHFCTYITCTKAFRTADSLKVHSLVHSDEKPLKCEHCEYTCRQKNSIRFHMKKKHPELLPDDLVSLKSTTGTVSGHTVSKIESAANSIIKADGDHENLPAASSDTLNSISEQSLLTDSMKNTTVDDATIKLETHARTIHDSGDSFVARMTPVGEKSHSDNEIPPESKVNLTDAKMVPSEFEINHTSVSTNQNHCDSQTATTCTNDLQELKETPRKVKKTDMYEFQSEDESSDEMRPGLLRKDYDKDKPPLPPVDAKHLPEISKTPKEEKPEPEEAEKPQKVRKKPGPKPKPKPEKQETEEVKVPKKRGRKKKSELEKQKKENKDKDENIEKPKEKSEKTKPGKRGRGRSPKAKKEEKNKNDDDDDDDDDDDEAPPPPKRKGRPPKKKPTEEKQEVKVPKKRGRKKKVVKEEEEKKEQEQEIVPENGDATINYSEVESNELFGDSTKDSMPDTNEMVLDNENLQGEIKADSDGNKSENEESSAFMIKNVVNESKSEEKKSDSESSDIGSDFDEDLKPPPAPRPPPMYDSEDGDIESGPENEDFNGSAMSNEPLRDFESSREISREISRDFESSREIDDSVKTNEYVNSVDTSTPKDTVPHSVGTPGSVNPYNRNDSVNNEHENPLSHHSSVPHTPSHNSVPPTPSANQEFQESRSIEHQTGDRIMKNPVQGQTNEENTDESSMPEVDKDYVGRFFEEIQCNQSEGQINRLSSMDENPKSQDKIVEAPRSDSGVPSSLTSNQTEGSMQMQSPPADLSHKRMDLISPERAPELYQPRSVESVHNRSSERIPSVPSFDPQYAGNPLDAYSASVPPRDTILRQPEQSKAPSPPITSTSFMRFPDSEAMLQRQRMSSASYDRNLQNLHRIAEGPLPHNNSSSPLLRHVPGREEMFSGAAAGVTGSMSRNPFHSSWTGQDVRPPHWGHPTYLQQQAGSASSSLFGKDAYLPGRDFMFDPSRAAAERNMFSTLSSAHSQRPEIPHDTFQFDRFDLGSYLSSHGYNAAPSLPVDYTRSAHSSSQKSLDERYRQPSTAVTDFRSLPPTSSASEMFGMNSSFNLEKFYSRDPMYHSQHITDNTNNPFLPGVPSQHSVFGRDYPHRSFYTQNTPYPFMNMNDKNYTSASAKLAHSSDSVNPQRDLVPVPRPNMTAPDAQLQDPYRHHSSMLYNMMNKYF